MKTVRNTEPERIDFCQSTNVPVPVRQMVWAKRKYKAPQANNYLPHSSYAAATYSCSATDGGTISIGPYADDAVVHRNLAGTASFTGVQTWNGSGTITLDSAITTTGWTAACFSLHIGPYHRETSPGGTVTISLLNGADDAVILARSFSFLGPRKIYVGSALNNASVKISVAVTASGYWYADLLSLEKNVLIPGTFVRTTGTAIDRTVDTVVDTVARIHESEVERVVEEWEKIGTPRGDPKFPTVTRQAF